MLKFMVYVGGLFMLLSSLNPVRADELGDLKQLISLQQSQIKKQSDQIQLQSQQVQALIEQIKFDKGLSTKGSINFGTSVRQMLNLWGEEYGVGVQANTEYFRTHGYFAFYKDGVHNDNTLNSGGGSTLMTIDPAGNVAASGAITARSLTVDSISVAGKSGWLTHVSCNLNAQHIPAGFTCAMTGGQVINGTCFNIMCDLYR